MVTPAKGDYKGVPITQEALQIVNAWNPAADEAAGNQCKSYGAAAIMRVPGRIHITWQDDNTLKLDTDAGIAVAPVHVRRGRCRHRRSRRGRERPSRAGNAPAAAIRRPRSARWPSRPRT